MSVQFVHIVKPTNRYYPVNPFLSSGGRHIKNDEFKTKVTENSMECYNPTTNQWTVCAPMQMRRYHHSMIEVNERIYVLGGMDATEV